MNIYDAFKLIFKKLSNRKKIEILFFLGLTIVTSVFEVVSIGSVLPLLSVITDNSNSSTLKYIEYIQIYFPVFNEVNIKLLFAIGFLITILITGILRTFLLSITTKISFSTGGEIGYLLYKKILMKGYSFHINDTSGDVVNTIIRKTDTVIKSAILPILLLISSLIIIIAIFIIMIYVNLIMTIVIFSVISCSYSIIWYLNRKKILSNSKIIAEESKNVIDAINDGFHGIRDIILNNDYDFYLRKYSNSDNKVRNAEAENYYLSLAPRYLIETIGVLTIVIAALLISGANQSDLIPLIGLFALSSQRALPYMQHTYASATRVYNAKYSVMDIANVLKSNQIDFNDSKDFYNSFKRIEFKNISFGYQKNKNIFTNANYTFNKNDVVGIVGTTGSGKSTFIDLLAGLLLPTEGSIEIDGVNINSNIIKWYNSISYLSQNFHLFNDTIANNIAYGRNSKNIDYDRLYACARNAQIYNDIMQMENNFNAYVGENGIRLSGGQRQRIGIARALYNNCPILILDEFTSSLDQFTEEMVIKDVLENINNVTVFIVAHRLTTLEMCDYIIDLSNT